MKNEARYIVTDIVSIPVVRIAKKSDVYRQATGAGWGTVDWWAETKVRDCLGNEKIEMRPTIYNKSDKTQVMYCDEDTSAVLYPKSGHEFCIFPDEEINLKEAPKQAETKAIIMSDSCGFSIWAKDISDIKIFVTYDSNGLIEDYRLDNWTGKPYDGETEIAFCDLQSEADYEAINRADIAGTFEHDKKTSK